MALCCYPNWFLSHTILPLTQRHFAMLHRMSHYRKNSSISNAKSFVVQRHSPQLVYTLSMNFIFTLMIVFGFTRNIKNIWLYKYYLNDPFYNFLKNGHYVLWKAILKISFNYSSFEQSSTLCKSIIFYWSMPGEEFINLTYIKYMIGTFSMKKGYLNKYYYNLLIMNPFQVMLLP